MAGFWGTGAANETLDAWLGLATLGPATVYVALFTAPPNAGGGGTEVSGSGYTRVAVLNTTVNWPLASGGTKNNGTQINFGTANNWGTVVWAAVVKTASGGLGPDDIIKAGPLVTPVTLASGPAIIPIGGITFTES